MTDIIIGFGEVGKALVQVLGERTDIAIHDPQKGYEAKRERTLYDENTPYPASVPIEYDWMHIAYPWHKEFVTTSLFNGLWKELRPVEKSRCHELLVPRRGDVHPVVFDRDAGGIGGVLIVKRPFSLGLVSLLRIMDSDVRSFSEDLD